MGDGAVNSKEWQLAKLRSLKPGETIVIESSVLDMLHSAELARIRLNGIVAQDRKACDRPRWRLVRKAYDIRWLNHNSAALRRWAKDVYRWAVRR